MSDVNELDALADRLREAARAYYDTDTLLMSDLEYDGGIEQLRLAIAEHPTSEDLAERWSDLLDEVAAGQSAGGDVEHPTLMGSMLKVPTIDSVKEFVEKVQGPVIVEPKLDGLAVRIVYTDGDLSLVATRGDGRTGEDITQQAKNLKMVPETLSGEGLDGAPVELRGEVFMLDQDFGAANAVRESAGGKAFVNTRNAAAGILRKGDAAYANLLQFSAYAVTSEAAGTDDYAELLSAVSGAGVLTTITMTEVGGYSPAPTADTSEVLERIDAIGQARADLGFPIDGAVVKAANSKDRERLGEGSKAPRWAVAYKYEAEEAETRVVAIHTKVGRTGRLSLQVEVDPVFVGGTTISYASGHNVQWMLDKGLRVGDAIKVRRAGDVIPYLSEVLLDKRPDDSQAWAPPEMDPMGRPWNKDTLLWRSTSPELTVLPTLEYGLSRDCLDVELVGTEIATALVDQGLVEDIADMFDLEQDQIAKLKLGSGRVVGDKVATKIIAELERAKGADWNRVITALGIRATGRTMGRRLAAAFPTMEALKAASVEDLANVEGIAAKKAGVIREGLDDLEVRGILSRLASAGVNMGSEPEGDAQTSRPLDGEAVVVTGKVGTLTRTEVQERVEGLGGRASSSVSKSTTLLVADPSATSSKVKKAKDLGIRIISPEEFLAL